MNAPYCSLSVGGSKCCLSHLSFSRLRPWRRHIIISCLALVLPMVPLRALDATWEYAVQVSASVQISPPQIALSWPPDLGATPNGYTVYRKAPEANSWSDGITLPGTATGFIDANVTIGATYEYQIVKAASDYAGYGYLYTGINAPLVEDRGKVVLLVDNTYAADLSAELARLDQDLVGDGWQVLRHGVARDENPINVKALIQSDYAADPANVKAVFLFGHVPVVRSGNLNVDGHQPRPMPADVFYGDMDGDWTDSDGDGVFDQNTIPTDVELEVGRVDFADLPGRLTWNGPPTFPGELELLRQYLNKDHSFRQGLMAVPRRALVGDGFGIFRGQAFAASGYRNFAPFFGPANIFAANTATNAPFDEKWVALLGVNGYLWAYGCGAGSYSSMSSLGTHSDYDEVWSTDIVDTDARAVFMMMFGSWLAEWDTEDNIMRAALATPTYGLTCSWSGRPHHFYHHMALGETIGYGIRLSQNNSVLYQNQVNRYTRGIHIALMGDPTLRMHPVAPPSALSAANVSEGVRLSWTHSPDSALGYHIYRATTPSGPFTRLTDSMLDGSSFIDSSANAGTYTYIVRAVKLEDKPSGTYYNASQGIFLTVEVGPANRLPVVTVAAADPVAGEEGPDSGTFTFTRTGSIESDLRVNYSLSGSALNGIDYRRLETTVTIPAGSTSAMVTVTPLDDNEVEGPETVTLTVSPAASYEAGSPGSATIVIVDTTPPAATNQPPTVTVQVTNAEIREGDAAPATFTFTRTGNTDASLIVSYDLTGTATKWNDYRRYEGDMPVSIIIPAGAASAALVIYAVDDDEVEGPETVTLTVADDPNYLVGSPAGASVTINDNDSTSVLPEPTDAGALRITSLIPGSAGGMRLTWNSEPGHRYRVVYRNSLSGRDWTDLSGDIAATAWSVLWIDKAAGAVGQRYYQVQVVN